MKKYLIIILLFISVNCFGQNTKNYNKADEVIIGNGGVVVKNKNKIDSIGFNKQKRYNKNKQDSIKYYYQQYLKLKDRGIKDSANKFYYLLNKLKK